MTIQQVKDSVKTGLSISGLKIQLLEDKLEKTEVGWTLTYHLFGVTFQSNFIVYTKFSFLLNKDKTELAENKMLLLKDYTCNYTGIDFNEKTLANIIIKIVKTGYDKGDIRDFSDFIINGVDGFNNELKVLKEENFFYSLDFIPKLENTCPNLQFKVKLTDNNKEIILLINKDDTKWNCFIDNKKEIVNNLTELYKIIPQKNIK